MVSKIDSIEKAWEDHRSPGGTNLYIGIDPGWQYGIGALNSKGQIIGLGGNKCSSWDELVFSIHQDAEDVWALFPKVVVGPLRIFIGIEGTHHFGQATNMDVSSIDMKIGMWIVVFKYLPNASIRPTIISLSPLTRKLTMPEFKSRFELKCPEPTTQHQIDACCLANRLYCSLRSPSKPKDQVKTKRSIAKGKLKFS